MKNLHGQILIRHGQKIMPRGLAQMEDRAICLPALLNRDISNLKSPRCAVGRLNAQLLMPMVYLTNTASPAFPHTHCQYTCERMPRPGKEPQRSWLWSAPERYVRYRPTGGGLAEVKFSRSFLLPAYWLLRRISPALGPRAILLPYMQSQRSRALGVLQVPATVARLKG